jgi:3-hydroxybutyryl-CoA dehydratase
MRVLENIIYDELHVGDFATFTKTLTEEELLFFAAASSDTNPQSLSLETVKKELLKADIGYGMWSESVITAAIENIIPGPGTIYLEQQLKFKRSVEIGNTLTVKLTIKEKLERHRVLINCEVTNQDAELVVSGEAKVIAPIEKLSIEQSELPRIKIL